MNLKNGFFNQHSDFLRVIPFGLPLFSVRRSKVRTDDAFSDSLSLLLLIVISGELSNKQPKMWLNNPFTPYLRNAQLWGGQLRPDGEFEMKEGRWIIHFGGGTSQRGYRMFISQQTYKKKDGIKGDTCHG